MADRVKYFLLGLLFLVVAGVIAYDRWNSVDAPEVPKGDASAHMTIAVEPPVTTPSPPPPRVDPEPAVPPPLSAADRSAKRDAEVRDELPPPSLPAVKAVPQPVYHIVADDENLEAIAMRYYKTAKGIDWIVDANGLRDANFIRAKQKLLIPPSPEGAAPKPPDEAARTKPDAKPALPATYRVRSGESDLYAICRKLYGADGLGARVARVMEANQLYSASVAAGTLLRLPK